jgi:hypothetical protein
MSSRMASDSEWAAAATGFDVTMPRLGQLEQPLDQSDDFSV